MTYLPDIHRTLPHSVDAEKGVLCSMLRDGQYIDVAVELLPAGAFYLPAHVTLYELLIEHRNSGKPPDYVLVKETLEDRGLLDNRVLGDIYGFSPTAANFSHYAQIVREKALARRLIEICTSSVTRSYDGESAPEILESLERDVFSLNRSSSAPEIIPTKEAVMQSVEELEKLYERKGELAGLGTGFSQFDNMTGGLMPQTMTVIAARPSHGKSAIAMNIAEHASQKVNVFVFSLEMSRRALMQRLILSNAKVNIQRVRDGFFSDRDAKNITVAASKLSTRTILIDESSSITISELRARARRYMAKYKIGLFIVDYLQWVKSGIKELQGNDVAEIAEASKGIKALAKELGSPFLVLAQLNRKPEERGGHPRLADLKGSGQIEQDADIVALLNRPELFASTDDEREELRGLAELDIAKQREGPTGTVKLTFLSEFCRFEDRAWIP